jgi:hypothetical protein
VTFAACADAGSTKHVRKIAKTEALNRVLFTIVMLLFFILSIVVSPGNSSGVPEIACDTLRGI